MNTKLKDLSLLDAADFLKAPGSLDASDNESFDVMGESDRDTLVFLCFESVIGYVGVVERD